MLVVDLDRFTLVDDSLGHAAGDALLAVAARRLVGLAAATEMVARFGGDEFVVAMVDAPAAAADRMAAAVIAALSAPVETGACLEVPAARGERGAHLVDGPAQVRASPSPSTGERSADVQRPRR